MKMNFGEFGRKCQLPVMLAAGAVPIPLLICANKSPEYVGLRIRLLLSYVLRTEVLILIRGKLRLVLGIIGAAALAVLGTRELPIREEAVLLMMPLLAVGLLLGSLQIGGWEKDREINPALYVVGVCYFTGTGTIYDGLMYRLEFRQNQINFIPFSHAIDIVGYLLNIVLFIPFGFLTPIIWRRMNKLTNVIGAGFFFTGLIEISQLLNNRATDVDDIILNLSGAVVGFGLFKVWERLTKSRLHIDNPIPLELPVCITVVLAGRFFFFDEMALAKLLYGF